MAEISDNKGAAALLSYIYPLGLSDMTEEQRAEFDAAAEEQLRYMDSAEGRQNTAIRQESVGDVSVTYAVTGEAQSGGVRIAPEAYHRLLHCGLLTRWV